MSANIEDNDECVDADKFLFTPFNLMKHLIPRDVKSVAVQNKIENKPTQIYQQHLAVKFQLNGKDNLPKEKELVTSQSAAAKKMKTRRANKDVRNSDNKRRRKTDKMRRLKRTPEQRKTELAERKRRRLERLKRLNDDYRQSSFILPPQTSIPSQLSKGRFDGKYVVKTTEQIVKFLTHEHEFIRGSGEATGVSVGVHYQKGGGNRVCIYAPPAQ